MSKAGDTVTVAFNGSDEVKGNARFYGVNALIELDQPSEYYISTKGLLYFYPPIPLNSWTSDPIVSTKMTSANITGTQNVVLRNMEFAYSRETGILAINVSNVTIENCTM